MRMFSGILISRLYSEPGQATAFENFLHHLLLYEAERSGIGRREVHLDWQTSSPDGGRDLRVDVGNASARGLIPSTPSTWSAKSGQEGTTASSFKAELLDSPQRDALRREIRQGDAFVLCIARNISIPLRKDLKRASADIRQRLGDGAGEVNVLFPDNLATWLSQHPIVWQTHMPEICDHLRILSTHDNWGRLFKRLPPWLDFDGRESLIDRLVDHLEWRTEGHVFHISGLQGTGKSRAAFEACDRVPPLGALYCPSFAEWAASPQTLNFVRDFGGTQVVIVVDETSSEESASLARQTESMSDRVRFITIGRASRPHVGPSELATHLEPVSVAGITQAVLGEYTSLSEDEATYVADQVGGDLWLALDFAQHIVRTGSSGYSRSLPNLGSYWLSKLGRSPDLRPAEIPLFQRCFSFLCAFTRVGLSGGARNELRWISRFLQCSEPDLDLAVAQAKTLELGFQDRDHFVAQPRGLARWLFEEKAWPIVVNRLSEFAQNSKDPPPSPLVESLLEMCQESRPDIREMVIPLLLER